MEIVFSVTQENDGGYVAECLSHDIFTQGGTWEELRVNVREAVSAYFLTRPNRPPCGCIWCGMNCWQAHETARDLSGAELIKRLCKHHGYRQVNQPGSQVILETESPRHHRLAVPDHNPLRVGTLNAILRAVAAVKGVEEEEILKPR